MSRPQQWTKEEAAVLLHGLLQIINCDVPRSEVIKQVSADLRKIATLPSIWRRDCSLEVRNDTKPRNPV